MKRALNKYVMSLVALVMLCLAGGATLRAQTFEHLADEEEDLFGSYVHVAGDYETMKNIRRYWVQEAQRYKQRNIEFRLTGGGEGVLKVTMPARVLFTQGDSALSASADANLRPLLRLVRGENAVAQLVIVCYTDNNGSERYLQRISSGRANMLLRWFAKQGVGPADLRSFGMANHVARNKNQNIREREQNRRVSFFLVPNKRMLRLAKKGKL